MIVSWGFDEEWSTEDLGDNKDILYETVIGDTRYSLFAQAYRMCNT